MYKDKCEQDGDCDHCLSDDCIATFSQASKFYVREEKITRQKYGVERKQFLGTKAEGLIQRTVAYCLSCKKAECNGCPTRAERARMKGEKCNGFD